MGDIQRITASLHLLRKQNIFVTWQHTRTNMSIFYNKFLPDKNAFLTWHIVRLIKCLKLTCHKGAWYKKYESRNFWLLHHVDMGSHVKKGSMCMNNRMKGQYWTFQSTIYQSFFGLKSSMIKGAQKRWGHLRYILSAFHRPVFMKLAEQMFFRQLSKS